MIPYISLFFFALFVIITSIIPYSAISRVDRIKIDHAFFLAVNTSNKIMLNSTQSVNDADDLISQSCTLWTTPNISRIEYLAPLCTKNSNYHTYVQKIVNYVVAQIIGLLCFTIVLTHVLGTKRISVMILLFALGICFDVDSLKNQNTVHSFSGGRIFDVSGSVYNSTQYPYKFDNQFELIELLCDTAYFRSMTPIKFDQCYPVDGSSFKAMIVKLLSLFFVVLYVIVTMYKKSSDKDVTKSEESSDKNGDMSELTSLTYIYVNKDLASKR